MKMRVVVGILAVLTVVATLSVCAVAQGGFDEVMFNGQLFCVGQDDCEAFAQWSASAVVSPGFGYVELLESAGGPVSDYIWVSSAGALWFESDDDAKCGGFCITPQQQSPGIPLLGTLVENGQFQEVDQFFPAADGRTLFVLSQEPVPEPSTLLLLGPAALFLFNRARRFGRG
jgi:PEP-CTERM motif-containing protein